MKHAILRNVGSAFLIGGLAFALPVYAAEHGAPGTMDGKGGVMGASEAQQMSGMMHDMSHEMKEISGMMNKGDMNPDAMKKTSSQMKQMGGMMENMSGMMGKGTMNDADRHKQMDQMRKQMDDMRKNMPAAPAKK